VPVEYNHDHDNEIAVFAETNFRNQRRRFGIKTDDRRRHTYIIGKTGMGKTNLLENLVYNDIMAGHGIGIVDPHGDFAERILDFVPSHRINDVVYMNPSDVDYPLAFNILETVDETHKHLIASGLMGVFKKIWPDVWSARMEYILNNTVLALLDYPGSTLLGINRMLADASFRKRVIAKIHDPVVKSFWVNEFAKYNERYASEAIAPIQNKVGQFLSASIIRNIVGQVKSTIDVREIMDSGKIFIMNLAKGRIGEDNSRLLGGMLITKIQLAAMERVDTLEAERRDFYLYVDEFQNFATESFSNILSEARKYRLNLVVAHQYIEQLDEKVAAAVFGNVGTIIAFRVGGADSLKLVQEFTPRFTEEDLVNLTKYTVYLKLMIDGVASDPFSAAILPPLSQTHGNHDKVVGVSRERYATERAVVEDKISRWSEGISGPTVSPDEVSAPRLTTAPASMRSMSAVPPVRARSSVTTVAPGANRPRKVPSSSTDPLDNPSVTLYTCSRCGASTSLNFIPDPAKPIYCKECLKEVRSGKAAPVVIASKPLVPPTETRSQQRPASTEIRPAQRRSGPPPRRESRPTSGGRAPTVSLEERMQDSPEPLSLGEAIARGPVDFRGERREQPKPSTPQRSSPTPNPVVRPSVPESPPVIPSVTEQPIKPVSALGEARQEQRPPTFIPRSQPTILKPGQSLKLNP